MKKFKKLSRSLCSKKQVPLPLLKQSKRHLLLLEVLIAFALLVFTILPLFYPLVYILKEQNTFVHHIQLDHAVNLEYAKIIQELYSNEIAWESMNPGVAHEVILSKDIPYKGFYVFGESIHKPSDEQDYMVYLKTLDFVFNPITPSKNKADRKKETLKYHYDICIIRDKRQP